MSTVPYVGAVVQSGMAFLAAWCFWVSVWMRLQYFCLDLTLHLNKRQIIQEVEFLVVVENCF